MYIRDSVYILVECVNLWLRFGGTNTVSFNVSLSANSSRHWNCNEMCSSVQLVSFDKLTLRYCVLLVHESTSGLLEPANSPKLLVTNITELHSYRLSNPLARVDIPVDGMRARWLLSTFLQMINVNSIKIPTFGTIVPSHLSLLVSSEIIWHLSSVLFFVK